MSLTLVLGGARSGKSRLAQEMASVLCAEAKGVTFIATAEALDADMQARIAMHKIERPSSWRTLEVPLEIDSAIAGRAPDEVLIIDCLTLWVSNMCSSTIAENLLGKARMAAGLASGRQGPVIVVSNEVGSGIVPEDAGVRAYRDLLGQVNSIFSSQADHAYLVVAGRIIELSQAPWGRAVGQDGDQHLGPKISSEITRARGGQ